MHIIKVIAVEETMKAAILKSPKHLEVGEADLPKVKEGEVLVKVGACGVCGSDLRFYEYGDRIKQFPFIMGHEIAGGVVEIGKGVENFAVGDRIAMGNEIPCRNCEECRRGLDMLCRNVISIGSTIPGGFAEYLHLPKEAVERGPINFMPKGMGFAEASFAEPLACVYNGLQFAGMKEGNNVLVIGAGPIGNLMINTAQIMGASMTVLVDKNLKRLEMSMATGADHYIHAENNDFVDEAVSLTGGRGFDTVISACSDINSHRACINAVAKGGFINLFGGVPKDLGDDITFQNNHMHYRQFAIGGSFSSTKEHHSKALEFLASGRIKSNSIITHKFPLDGILEAFDTVKNREGLKVVILPE